MRPPRGKDRAPRRRSLAGTTVITLLKQRKNDSAHDEKNTESIVLPPPPANLNKRAADEWRLMGNKFIERGFFDELDTGALALYCEAYAEWIEAGIQMKKSKKDIWLRNKKTGSLYRNPIANELKSARRDYMAALALFGLSPADRAKIFQSRPAKKHNEPNAFDGM